MATLLERSNQAIPITEVSRSSKRILDDFLAGEKDKYVVMRNNAPAAVMMSVEHYENMSRLQLFLMKKWFGVLRVFLNVASFVPSGS